MPDHNDLTAEELTRQAQHHLRSLKEAGLDWLPLGDPLPTPVALDEPAPAPSVASQLEAPAPGLFAANDNNDMPAEQRRIALDLLKEVVSTCSRCAELVATRTQTVFGEGALDADICFIGEAPGFNEDQQGRPFVGEAGQLLDKIIVALGFQREDVYICNILRCRPPGNRTPQVSEAQNCRSHLERQLELVRPKYIVALGACAAQNLLGTTDGIGRMRRRFHDYNGIPVLCTYHPAYLLRSPDKKRDVWEDMKLLLQHMGRPIPKK